MRFFKVFLADECLAEIHYDSAVGMICEMLGRENLQKVLYTLSQGDTVSLRNRWTIQEKLK